MAPSAPRTRAAAALRMKQIALDNQGRTIRRLRAQLANERRGLATLKKELEDTQVALEASHKVIAGLTEIGLSMSKKIERMKVKKQKVRANHEECHQKFHARIHEAKTRCKLNTCSSRPWWMRRIAYFKPSTASKKPTMPLPHSMVIGKKNRKKNWKRKRLRIFLWARER
ncbi:cytosolic purine 5'-nucleotidase-like [Dorcoceras hygrometricum]|uniref:Cytosolic purine 5'-nucleotidase-like n=1 Tax=Dorcoceras hygrometricum TaxID=472368 RepID=A0A2Z7C010_9LAMI|nr:cytosolic purine 5'-nucleotidase-like [Dorcoceras hygrometricum]